MGGIGGFVVQAVVAGFTGGSSFALSTGLSIGFSFAAAGFAAALGVLSLALTPKPKRPTFDIGSFEVTSERDRTLSFRQAITTRKLCYGEIKVGGPIAFISTTDDGSTTNGFLPIITFPATHEIQS